MKPSKRISTPLLTWFHQHGRKDLPWQHNVSPYRVWVSEIMLQQTQVTTVIPYYLAFMKSFATVEQLAHSPLDQVLHHWSGLGYYARARNLHKAANIIVTEHDGQFPQDFDQVLALPGIGASTAGAILSLACQQRHAILDGNVKRVLCRYQSIAGWPGDKKVADELWKLAQHYTPEAEHVAHYNQAIMDLGATVCKRGKPLCQQCPLQKHCMAHQQGQQDLYPHSKPKKTLPSKSVYMLLLHNQAREILLLRRPPTGIWGGLWSLPECSLDQDPVHWTRQHLGLATQHVQQFPQLRHRFSHYELIMHPVELSLTAIPDGVMEPEERIWYSSRNKLGLPSPIKTLLTRHSQEAEGEVQ